MKKKHSAFCAVDKQFKSDKNYGVKRDCRNELFYSKKPMRKTSTQKELFGGAVGRGVDISRSCIKIRWKQTMDTSSCRIHFTCLNYS